MNQPGGQRLALADVGGLLINESGRSVEFQIFDAEGDEWATELFVGPRKSFVEEMKALASRTTGLPGLSDPAVLLGREPVLAHLEGRVIARSATPPPPSGNKRANLIAQASTLSVITVTEGIVWRSLWADITTSAYVDAPGPIPGNPGAMLLELATRSTSSRWDRLVMALPPLALFSGQARPTDEFLLHEAVRPHLQVSPWKPDDSKGAQLLAEFA